MFGQLSERTPLLVGGAQYILDKLEVASQDLRPDGRPSVVALVARCVLIFAAFAIETGIYGVFVGIATYLCAEFFGTRSSEASKWMVSVVMVGVALGGLRGLWHVLRYLSGRG